MNITAIRTDKDLEKALSRVDVLMEMNDCHGPAAGTEELDELDVLSTLISVYEEKLFLFETLIPIV